MNAILLHAYGNADQLKYESTDDPQPASDGVLVRVLATSINPVDWKMRSGAAKEHFPVEFPGILGRDLSGEVLENSTNADRFPIGARVMGLTWRTYAEQCVAKSNVLAPIPEGLSFEQAAALPLVLLTGTQLIEHAIQLQSGQTILVTGALGGVGRTAVHVARKLGARVLAGVRATQKDDAASLGADEVIALDRDDEVAGLRDLDAIADTVGGKTTAKLLNALRPGGVLGSVVGPPSDLGGRDIQVKLMTAVPDAARLEELAGDVVRGELVIPIARSFPLKKAAEAHKFAEQGGAGGKVLLIP